MRILRRSVVRGVFAHSNSRWSWKMGGGELWGKRAAVFCDGERDEVAGFDVCSLGWSGTLLNENWGMVIGFGNRSVGSCFVKALALMVDG